MAQRILNDEERWRYHISRTPRGDKNEGLTEKQKDVLLNSEDSAYKVKTTLPSGEYLVEVQKTDDEESVVFLQSVGLVRRVTVNEPGVFFAFTPVGIAQSKRFLGAQ